MTATTNRFRGYTSYFDYYLANRDSLIGPDDPRYGTGELVDDITPEELAAFDDRDRWAALTMSYGEDIVGPLEEFLAREHPRTQTDAEARARFAAECGLPADASWEEIEAELERRALDASAEAARRRMERAPAERARWIALAEELEAKKATAVEGAVAKADAHFREQGRYDVTHADNEWNSLFMQHLREDVVPIERDAAYAREQVEVWSALAGTEAPPTPAEKAKAEREEAERRREERRREEEIAKALERLEVQEEAKKRLAAKKAGTMKMPTGLTGDELLAADYGDESAVIDGFLEFDGNTVLLAQKKAGKSTMMLNLIRSLVDGDPFLDEFKVHERRRVAYLDFEMSDRRAQVWARQQRILHNGDWKRFGLRGLARTFDIRDEATRARWAEQLRGYDVLILDPMRPLLDALGLKEATEMGVVLEAFDALKVAAGMSEGVVVHHMGWDDSHGRGDSRQVDWPDTIAHLRTSDPDDPGALRFLQARGRGDIDIPEGLVSKYDGTRLAYAREGVRQAKETQSVEALAEYVSQRPGCNIADVKSAGLPGITANTVSRVRMEAERRGLIRSESGPKNSTLLYPVD